MSDRLRERHGKRERERERQNRDSEQEQEKERERERECVCVCARDRVDFLKHHLHAPKPWERGFIMFCFPDGSEDTHASTQGSLFLPSEPQNDAGMAGP